MIKQISVRLGIDSYYIHVKNLLKSTFLDNLINKSKLPNNHIKKHVKKRM